MNSIRRILISIAMIAAIAITASPGRAAALDSRRVGLAKDYIADEQWTRAIEVLRAAVRDPQEKGKDEALYWLAHSLNQAGDPAAALQTILRLERQFPTSLWVKPAGSLRLDIALHLGRNDVLWYTAAPPPPPPAVPRSPSAPRPPAATPPPPSAARPAAPAPPPAWAPAAAPVPPPAAAPPNVPTPPVAPTVWLPERYQPDMDLRIQALGILIRTDAALKVIPMLKEIALESEPGEARRALFVLAQSNRPEARATVVQVARSGPEPVRIAAVRELGKFAGPDVSEQLLQVYFSGNEPVKRQVVTSFGERAEKVPLMRIAQSEKNPTLRESAILMLGHAGGSEQLRSLYARASTVEKRAIIVGLFNARAEDDLIGIAEREKDAALRSEARMRLTLIGTPKAREYLQKTTHNR